MTSLLERTIESGHPQTIHLFATQIQEIPHKSIISYLLTSTGKDPVCDFHAATKALADNNHLDSNSISRNQTLEDVLNIYEPGST
jgi:hypothetical protein